MSTNNRVGRNPFDKKPKASSQAIHASEASQNPKPLQSEKAPQTAKVPKLTKSSKASETAQAELDLKVSQATSSDPILKVSDRKTEAEEQIIGELIDLPEENWQPLSMVPTQFIKQLFSRWL